MKKMSLANTINEGILTSTINQEEPILFIKSGPVRANQDDPTDKSSVPGIWITSKGKDKATNITDKEIAIISKYCPEACLKGKGGLTIALRIKESDINTDAVRNTITKLANGLTACKVFGKISPEDIMNEIAFESSNSVKPETISNMKSLEKQNFEDIVTNFDDEAVQAALSRIHVFTIFKGLSYELTYRNIRLIDAQNRERVNEGLDPVTYILSPEDWFTLYKRRVNRDAKPVYYWAPHKTGYTSDDICKAENQVFGDISPEEKRLYMKHSDIKRNVNIRAQKSANPTPTYYALYPYYDIKDTTSISGFGDEWYNPDRIGVVNNIHLEPTASAKRGLSQNSEENAEILKSLENTEAGKAITLEDVEHTLRLFAALQNISKQKDYKNNMKRYDASSIMGENGQPNMDVIKQAIFENVKGIAMVRLGEKYAKVENCEDKAEMVACIIVSQYHVSSMLALQKFAKLKKNVGYTGTLEDGTVVPLTKKGDGQFYYRKNGVGAEVPYNGQPVERKLSDVLLDNAYPLMNTVNYIETMISNELKGLKNLYPNFNGIDVLKRYLAEGYSKNGCNEEYEFKDFDNEVLGLYDEICNKAQLDESCDDWFEPETQETNDFNTQKNLEFDSKLDKDRQMAENKFYEMINRINKLY